MVTATQKQTATTPESRLAMAAMALSSSVESLAMAAYPDGQDARGSLTEAAKAVARQALDLSIRAAARRAALRGCVPEIRACHDRLEKRARELLASARGEPS